MPGAKVELTIRPLPHQDLILGHVGLPPCAADATSAPAAVVAGRVLVRPTSTQNNIIKAHKLEISLVKLDVLGLKPQNRVTSTVAHQQLWAKTAEQNSLSGEVEFRFRLAIPENAPPSVHLAHKSGTGIFYELFAELHLAESPWALFSCVAKKSHPTVAERRILPLDRMDLLPTWPIYRSSGLTEEKSSQQADGTFTLIARRATTAAGSGDEIVVPVHLRAREPCTVEALTFALVETTTIRPPKSPLSTQSVKDIFRETFDAEQGVVPGDDHRFELRHVLPNTHTRVTCRSDTISIVYHLRITVRLLVPGEIGPSETVDLELDRLPLTVSTWSCDQAQVIMDRILAERNEEVPVNLQARLPESPKTSPRSRQATLPPQQSQVHSLEGTGHRFHIMNQGSQSTIRLRTPQDGAADPEQVSQSSFQGARTAVSTDPGLVKAPPPSTQSVDGGAELNPAEQAYHNARLAERTATDSAGSSDERRRMALGAASPSTTSGKMVVSNPDDVPVENPPERTRASVEVAQEAPLAEKARFKQEVGPSTQAPQETAAPAPREHESAEQEKRRLMRQLAPQGSAKDSVAPGSRYRRDSDPYEPNEAMRLSRQAVSHFELAVAARDKLLNETFQPGSSHSPDQKIQLPTSDSDEKSRVAASEKDRLEARHQLEEARASTTGGSNNSPAPQPQDEGRRYAEQQEHKAHQRQRSRPLPQPANEVAPDQLNRIVADKERVRHLLGIIEASGDSGAGITPQMEASDPQSRHTSQSSAAAEAAAARQDRQQETESPPPGQGLDRSQTQSTSYSRVQSPLSDEEGFMRSFIPDRPECDTSLDDDGRSSWQGDS